MKIQMIDTLAGINQTWLKDQQYDLSDALGKQFVSGKVAVEVKPKAKPEAKPEEKPEPKAEQPAEKKEEKAPEKK